MNSWKMHDFQITRKFSCLFTVFDKYLLQELFIYSNSCQNKTGIFWNLVAESIMLQCNAEFNSWLGNTRGQKSAKWIWNFCSWLISLNFLLYITLMENRISETHILLIPRKDLNSLNAKIIKCSLWISVTE